MEMVVERIVPIEGEDLRVRVNGARVAAANTPKTALTVTGIFLAVGIVAHLRMVTWNKREA